MNQPVDSLLQLWEVSSEGMESTDSRLILFTIVEMSEKYARQN